MPFPVLQFLKVQPELLDTMKRSPYTLPACAALWCFPEYDPTNLTSRRPSIHNESEEDSGDGDFDDLETDEHWS
jgi:hypothetical protein